MTPVFVKDELIREKNVGAAIRRPQKRRTNGRLIAAPTAFLTMFLKRHERAYTAEQGGE